MHIAVPIILLVATTIAVSVVARRIGLSAPLLLVAAGAAASYLPGVPEVHVNAEVILLGFLPPLLYSTAVRTSLIDLRRDIVQILALSIGLVIVTALAVGATAFWIMGVPLAAAIALGGVVAPPDAVAATAVARRIGLPRRLVNVLEGESLFNDATALVIVSTAVAAMTADVSPAGITRDFLVASVGGTLIGFVAFLVIGFIHRRVQDTATAVGISFMTPWIAFLPAEEVHSSGVIAVVVCGVLLGFRAPYIQTAQTRVSERMNWAAVQFILENLVFLLIGLQVATIIGKVSHSSVGLGRTVGYALAVLAVVMVVRPIYLLLISWLGKTVHFDPRPLTYRQAAVGGWAGMRGVVTLAAALLLPQDNASASTFTFIALTVTVGTLVLQGFSLGWLARRMGLHAPDPREDALAVAQLTQGAVDAGLKRMAESLDEPEFSNAPDDVVTALEKHGERRTNLVWERLGSADTTAPTQLYRQIRHRMIESERDYVVRMRNAGKVDHEIIEALMMQLDVEESMITFADDRDADVAASGPLLTPEERQGGCKHLVVAAHQNPQPQSVDGCPECLAADLPWVHLRMCLECGHVGCCDSSEGQHAQAHWRETGHPVMRSFEPGEEWRWCFEDHLPG